MQLAPPSISNDELMAFFETHFSDAVLQTFKFEFFNSKHHLDTTDTGPSFDNDGNMFDEDDGLGYYPDGVKRTLTDQQIAIFRRSELEALKREQARAADRRSTSSHPSQSHTGQAGDDGNREATESSHPSGKATKNKKKKKGGKGGKNKTQEPKPDLRKRTWDVVEAGLDTLDYD